MKKRTAAKRVASEGDRSAFLRPGERRRTSSGTEEGRCESSGPAMRKLITPGPEEVVSNAHRPAEGIINFSRSAEGRRNFLRRAWKILGLVAVAELIVFVVSLLKPSREAGSGAPGATLRVLGNIEDFPPGTVTPDRINRLYIVREKDGGFLALSIVCPHLGCSVLWDGTKSQFDCPCHSSAFDRQGVVLSSPAPRPLDYFPVIIEEGKVKVDISRQTKRKRFEQEQVTYAV